MTLTRYANGGWIKSVVIPPDLSAYGTVPILAEQVRKRKWQNLIQGTSETQPSGSEPRSAESQKVGIYYSTFMDEKVIEAKGKSPLAKELAKIAAISDKKALSTALGETLRSDVDPLNNTNYHTANLFGALDRRRPRSADKVCDFISFKADLHFPTKSTI